MNWKYIKGYPRYMVSDHDQIKSFARKIETILSGSLDSDGYLRVLLYVNQKTRKTFLVHRLVGMHFIDNPENKCTINHKDGNKLNNHVSNLEWATLQEQIKHAVLNGFRGSVKGIPKTAEHKANLSRARIGTSPWNKGKKGCQVAWNKGLKMIKNV